MSLILDIVIVCSGVLTLFFPVLNPLSANARKWLDTLKQFVGNLPTNYLCMFDHFGGLALKGLRNSQELHWSYECYALLIK